MFLIHTDTSFCTILDFTVIQTCFWSLSILNWPEKERVEQHLRRQGWAAHPLPAERGLLTSRIYRCDLSSELKESSTPTFKVESVHNKKVSKTGTAGKAENFRKLKILCLVPIIPHMVKLLYRSEILHNRRIRKTAISGSKYHLCSMCCLFSNLEMKKYNFSKEVM